MIDPYFANNGLVFPVFFHLYLFEFSVWIVMLADTISTFKTFMLVRLYASRYTAH